MIPMLRRSRLFRAVTVSLVVGLLGGLYLAGVTTHIVYPCSPEMVAREQAEDDRLFGADNAGPVGCVSWEKAFFSHPSDVWSNVQGSRTEFISTFLVVFGVAFGVVFMLLLLVNTARAARAGGRAGPSLRD